jgi:RNA polymerase sigma factor (sigma-70 family)
VINMPTASVRGDLATLFEAGAVGLLSDSELLTRFNAGRGDAGSEAAFEILVARHGPMVLGVCRRMLGDVHAAADAFQATFLILARKATTVRVEDSLGRWLYGVSTRVARRSRAITRGERARLRGLDGIDPPEVATASPARRRDDLRASIDEEIARLPDRYRSAVVLCYLEGLTQAEAAHRLSCPVGTIESRLHRARERLRSGLTRRGLAPTASALATLAATTSRADITPGLKSATVVAAARIASGRAIAGVVPTSVAALTRQTLRGMLMSNGWRATLLLATIGMTATGAGVVAGGDEKTSKPPNPPADAVKPGGGGERELPIADRFARIIAEYRAEQDTLSKALEKVEGQQQQIKLYATMAPDEVAYCRRMIDLAMSAPTDPGTRSALIWVVNKPGWPDEGAYGDELARAAAMLVRHHGDDPEAVRLGLRLDNLLSSHRDALLLGFYASAKGREAKGLARLALAQYLDLKARFAIASRTSPGRQKYIFTGVIGDDGKPYDKVVEQSDEGYAYALGLGLCDADKIRAEAERLYAEVISDFGDVPHITVKTRELEALLKEPVPKWNSVPMKEDELVKLRAMVARKWTLADEARGRLDEMNNLVVGKPAPAIDGVDVEGKPLKLSDYRGKVVVLVFWGSWCGPCMAQVPHERELVARLKDRPFALLGVDCREERSAALKTMKAKQMTWPSWHDGDSDGPIVASYHVRGYPSVFVLDAKGIIRGKGVHGASLDKLVDDLLKEIPTKGS